MKKLKKVLSVILITAFLFQLIPLDRLTLGSGKNLSPIAYAVSETPTATPIVTPTATTIPTTSTTIPTVTSTATPTTIPTVTPTATPTTIPTVTPTVTANENITSTPANTPTNTPLPVVTHVGGNISQNTIWTNNYTYVVDSTITVQQGVNLQITEGVVVKFSAGTQINVNGILTVAGTEQDNVVFTAIKDAAYGGSGVNTTTSNDYWLGISVSSTGEFTGDYVKIRYAGSYLTYSGSIDVFGKLTLTNSEVTNSNRIGVYVNTVSDVSIKNSRIENSVSTGIYIANTTTGAVTIENNTVTGNTGSGIEINRYGTGVLSISGNNITNNSGYPIYIPLDYLNSSIFSGIQNNIYTGNTTGGITYDAVVISGTPIIDLTLSTATYYMVGDIKVSTGRILTVQPGVIIKSASTVLSYSINVEGKLNAIGTEASPIVFTKYKDAAYGGSGVNTTTSNDYWLGISVSSTGEFTGDYVKIRYAGNYLTYQGALNVFGKLSLTNSEVSNSWNKGVYFQTTIPPVLLFNAFLANAGEMYNYNSSTMTIDASYNYWNSYFGPSVYNNVTGTWVGDGDKVGSGINYIPWLGSEMKYQFKFGEDGVNSGTGNFSRTYTDLSVKSPGFDISFGRTYNSRNDKITSMGRGWTFSYECRVKDAESSYVQSNGTIASYKIPNYKIVNLPDGSIQTFKENSDGTYTATNSRNKLVKQNGTYVLTTKSQTSFYFNTNGYLVKAQDRNGNAVKLVVDSNGKVQSVTDQADRVFNITYENGNIKTINDIAGNRTVTYEYLNNQLVKVYDPMGHVTNYYYDSEGFLNEIKDQNLKTVESLTYIHTAGENKDKVHTITDAYGNTITYSYDNANMRTTKTDSNGRQTIERYDSSYNVIDSYDPENRVTTYEYYLDSNGENKYSELKSVRDRNGNKTQYQRDGNGNITRIINPDNSTKVMTYDDNNNLTSEMDENGKYTFYVYDDEKKNLVKKVQPLNGTDQYTGTDSSNFAITYYTYYTDAECIAKGYKARGLLKQEIDPEGNITKYEYNANGDVTKVTDPEDNDLNMEYDAVGRKISETTAEGFLTTYTYDKNGKLEKQVQNEGETTRITYDIHGWTTKEVSPNLYNAAMDDIENHAYNDNKGTRYTYYDYGKVNTVTDAEDNTTTYTYDSYGNVITETKPNGSVYIYQYDVMNRLTHVYFKDNAQAAQILLTEYSYTILTGGNTQKTETKYLNDTETAVTVTTYDYAGRQIIQQNPDGTTQSVSYNANGTVNTTTDRAGKVTYYKYDVLNKLTEQWVPFETVNGNIKYSYSKSIYDKAGREIQKIVGKDTVGLYEIPSQLITTNYSYYKNGLVKSVADNEGRTIEYRYDSDGNVSEEKVYTDSNNYITTKYTNNHLNKPTRKEVYAKACDIYGNDINSTAESILTTIYTYDNNGNLLTVKTPDQVTTTYTYDALNRQTGVSQPGTDEYGTSVNIVTSTEYNWEGKVVSTKDANENTTNNSYNQRGLLERVTDAKNNVTAYYYDRAGRKIAEVAPNDFDPAKTLDQLNRVVYTYDKMDRVKTKAYIGDEKVFDAVNNCWITQNVNLIQKAYKYDNNGNVIKELDGLGYEAGTGSDADTKINTGYGTTYTYNLANKVVTILDPVSNERSLSYSTKYSYDALGRKTSETNAKGVITNYYYDDAGKVLAVKVKKTAASDEQAIKSYTYDFIGNVLTQTDGNGNTTTFEYNVFNKIRKAIYPGDTTIPQNTIVYQYDVQGNLKYQKDTKGAVDTYNYDNQGRVISHTQMKQDGTDDITTTFKYDKNGNKRFEVDGNNTQKEFTYNELNQNITESINVSGITQTTTYGFDSNGNKTTLTDWRGRTTTNVYDSLNRLIEKIDAYNISIQKIEYNHNNCQIKSYDALNNITQNTYDKNNRLLSTIDPENHITSQTYDNVGNIDTKKDGENNQTTYTYDEFNRLISVKNAKNENTDYTYDLNGNMLTQTDGKRNVTTFEYNTANKLVKRIDNGGRTGTSGNYVYDMTKVDTYTYNADGSLSQKVDKNNATTTYTYDIHGRLTNQTTVKTGSTTVTISYTYDGNGNRLTVTDSTGTTTRTYDELNRVKTKIVPNIGSTTYTYDIITNVPTGCIGESTTDPKGNITTKVYDKVGRLLTVTADGRTTTYSYFDNGNRQSVTYFNGAKEEYTYYRDNLLWTLTNKKPDGSTMDTYTYTYDAAHNQTSKVEFVNGALKGTTSYTYDSLNRLLSVTEPSGKVTVYTYDAAGNRETETITSGSITTVNTYSYNGQNRLTGIETRVNNVVTETTAYTYDNNGNQLTVSKNSQITATNTYDLINQLTATTTGGKTITNKYNGEGLRVEKSVDGQTTRYLYEYDKVVLEVDSSGNQTGRNVYGTNLLTRTADGQTVYYMYNGHGDVTALLDVSTDKIVAGYSYDEWGQLKDGNEIDGEFETDLNSDGKDDNWSFTAGFIDTSLSSTIKKTGTKSQKLTTTSSLNASVHKKDYATKTGHKYMFVGNYYIVTKNGNLSTRVNSDGTAWNLNLGSMYWPGTLNQWKQAGVIFTAVGTKTTLIPCFVDPQVSEIYLDNWKLIDLTAIYGAGNEPTSLNEALDDYNNPIRYAGYQYDSETGLYYLNARMYDPKIARFLQEDTYTGDVKDPLSLNLYTYCHNEPIMYTDPTGHVEVGLRKIVEDAGGEVYWIASKGYAIASVNGRVRFFWPTYNAKLKNDNKMYIDSEDFDQAFHTNSQYDYGRGLWIVKNVSDADYYRPSSNASSIEYYDGKWKNSLPVSGSELDNHLGFDYIWDANCYSYSLNLHKYPDGDKLPTVGLFGNRGGIPGDIALHVYLNAFEDFSEYTIKKMKNNEKLTNDEEFVRRVLSYNLNRAKDNQLHENYDNILECIRMDSEALGLKFKVVKKDEIPVEGTYKVMVNVKSSPSFHFKRQDPNGFWSEKSGGLPTIATIEFDPEKDTYGNNQFFVIGSLNIRGASQITK